MALDCDAPYLYIRALMKSRMTPTEITLKDIPAEGRDFDYDRESGELNAALHDLVGENPYRVHLHITPMGNAFDLRGEVETALNLLCATCGTEFKYPVKHSLHELMVVEKPLNKNEHHSRANHAHEWENSGPDCLMLDSDILKVKDYLHEMIALAEPIRPLCSPSADEDRCSQAKDLPERDWLSFGPEKPGEGIRTNPFNILQKVKLKG
jgi:uncharacterized metal-binding protein YceD (DUF177 family)